MPSTLYLKRQINLKRSPEEFPDAPAGHAEALKLLDRLAQVASLSLSLTHTHSLSLSLSLSRSLSLKPEM